MLFRSLECWETFVLFLCSPPILHISFELPTRIDSPRTVLYACSTICYNFSILKPLKGYIFLFVHSWKNAIVIYCIVETHKFDVDVESPIVFTHALYLKERTLGFIPVRFCLLRFLITPTSTLYRTRIVHGTII